MAAITQQDTEILAARVPRRILDQIETIAQNEDENRSTIVRRLLRRALEQEGRGADRTEHARSVR
jgi:metal-responsive CopG/Arc/MetJ family transcriptional regulator